MEDANIGTAVSRLAVRLRGADARIAGLERLTGGASLETWRFAIARGGGEEPLILRRCHDSAQYRADAQAISLEDEARLLRAAAAAGVPVPPLVHLCDASDGLGEAHVTGFVVGETRGRRIVADAAFAPARAHLAFQCGEILARIHAIASIEGHALATEDAHAILDRSEAVYRAAGLERPVLELAFAHLRAHAPSPVPARLVHGDFRNGNFIVDPLTGIAAVLDWELAHLGDPAEDLGWLCVNSWRFGETARAVGGFGTIDQLLAGYAAAGGRPPDISRVRYWQAIGSLKWAMICLMMYQSWASGAAPSVERPMIGRRMSEAEIDILDLLEAGL